MTQISPSICPVFSVCCLGSLGLKPSSDRLQRLIRQLTPRLNCVFARCTGHFVGAVMLCLNSDLSCIMRKPVYAICQKQRHRSACASVKILNSDTRKVCRNCPKIWTRWLYHRIMYSQGADGMSELQTSSRSSLIWIYEMGSLIRVCTVCPRSVWKLRHIMLLPGRE